MSKLSSYQIQSVLISPDAWLFQATTAKKFSKHLKFFSPGKHRHTRHIVMYECQAENIDEAWRKFYKEVSEYVEAAVFYTSSYISFHDWNHLIINKTQDTALLSIFQRTNGTTLGMHTQQIVDEVQKMIAEAKNDTKLKNFLHCYRMAVLVDAPETHDAYEKYLILACESLAGEVNDGNGGKKYDRKRQESIIGKELHKYFFSSVDPVLGKTIRNANMHTGKSPNQKPSKTIELVNKLREFVAKEYGLRHLTIIEQEYSPTRGRYRDDGGRVILSGDNVDTLELMHITDGEKFIRNLPIGMKILGGQEANMAFKSM